MIIRLKRASKSTWETKNPILQSGEPGIEKGENGKAARMKIGNGLADWNDLPYATIAPDQIETFINTYLANFDWSSLNIGNEKYSTVKPTEMAVGGVPIGTSFTNATVKKVFDMMFYGDSSSPVPPSLSVITPTPAIPSLKVGDTFNLTKLSVTAAKGENPIVAIVLKKNGAVVQTITNKPDGGLVEFVLSDSLTANTVYTVEVSDGTLSASQSLSIVFAEAVYKAPTISSFTGTPSNSGIKTEPVLITNLTASVTAGTEPITKVEFLQGSTVIHTITSPSNGGTYTYNPNVTINATTSFYVRITDSTPTPVSREYKYTVSLATTVKIYWGIGADEFTTQPEFTEAEILAFMKSPTFIKSREFRNVTEKSNQICNFRTTMGDLYSKTYDGGHYYYAYPKEWGLLPKTNTVTKIGIMTPEFYDVSHMYTYTDTTIDDIDYYVYYTLGYRDPGSNPGQSILFYFKE